jgi:hypothetical protein
MIGALIDAAKLLSMVGESGASLSDLLSLDLPLPIRSSSCISSATYNIADATLELTFAGGNSAEYTLSIITVINLLNAGSLGRFYNQEIKGK